MVATAALGGIAYLADFAIGGSIAIAYGFTSAVVAILAAAVIIFATSVPIAYYSAKHSIDMDLLTRGAGFGYLGSTLTSVIYASFTFIFFALEGSIMAQAFQLGLHIPLAISYLISSLLVIPLVIFGMTALSRLQVWTQPIWLVLWPPRSSRLRPRTHRPSRTSRTSAASRRRARASASSRPARAPEWRCH